LPGGLRANQLPDSATDLPSGFLANLGRPARESSCECERNNELQLGSIMALLSGPALADAIGDANNHFAKLVAAQPDDAKVVDEVFTRVLNRPATPVEIERTLKSWAAIDSEHAALTAMLDIKEKQQAPLIAKAEADRLAAINAAKAELARYEAEIAPKAAEAERKRIADAAAAEAAVKDYEQKNLAAAQAAFEATVPAARTYTGWVPLDFAEARATGGIVLEKQPDGSLKAGGARPGKTDYTLKCDTKIAGITGILLEVLNAPDEPAFGPGRFTDGNFVLGEIDVKTGDFGAATGTIPAKLSGAIADFSQTNFEVAKAIDGKKGDGNNGWAVSNQFGVPHYAAFAFEKPQGDATKGIRFRIELNQPRDGGFAIARFRVWITTSTTPLNIGLPAPVAEALKKPAQARSTEEQAAIAAYWNENDPELRKRRLIFGKAQLPLPTDPGILLRRDAIVKAEEPIRLDPQLVQLRKDAEQSTQQLANKRLTGVQDIAWALINNPAFFFNH
jgi:hypothetical protein